MATTVSLANTNSITIAVDGNPAAVIPWATVTRIDPYRGPAYTTDRTAGTPTPAQVAGGAAADIGGYRRRATDEFKIIITADDVKFTLNLENVTSPAPWNNGATGLDTAMAALIAARNAATS